MTTGAAANAKDTTPTVEIKKMKWIIFLTLNIKRRAWHVDKLLPSIISNNTKEYRTILNKKWTSFFRLKPQPC